MSSYRRINFDEVEAYKANVDDGYKPTEHNEIETEDKLEEVCEKTMPEVEEFKPVMTDREIDKIKSTFTSMTEDEKQIVLSTVPSEKLWEELRRRNTLYQNKIETFNEIMGVSLNTINPINDASWIGIVDRYTDVEVRFNEIARVMGV